MTDEPVSLELLATLLRRMQTDQAAMRDDLAVQFAMLQRIDGTLSGMTGELRAMHSQHARMGARVRELEG